MSRAQLALRLLRTGLGRFSPDVAAVARRAGPPRSGHQLVNVVRKISTLGLPIDSEHTAKWMIDFQQKSPMELIAEIPPVEVRGRVVACEGDGIQHSGIQSSSFPWILKNLQSANIVDSDTFRLMVITGVIRKHVCCPLAS